MDPGKRAWTKVIYEQAASWLAAARVQMRVMEGKRVSANRSRVLAAAGEHNPLFSFGTRTAPRRGGDTGMLETGLLNLAVNARRRLPRAGTGSHNRLVGDRCRGRQAQFGPSPGKNFVRLTCPTPERQWMNPSQAHFLSVLPTQEIGKGPRPRPAPSTASSKPTTGGWRWKAIWAQGSSSNVSARQIGGKAP